MKALITGASSGIGREMALYLSELGHDLVLVARNRKRLEDLVKEIKTNAKIVIIDLSDEKRIKDLYMIVKNEDIDILINNAGFGLFGKHNETDLIKELEMIDVNIKAVHILTKMFLKDMQKRTNGYILNVASAAGLLKGGPDLSTYYATKSYVASYSFAIYEELKRDKANISISVLCPGPVSTNFDTVAGVKFSAKSLDSKVVARYAIDQMFKKKLLIIPGTSTRISLFLSRFVPTKLLLKITASFQRKKG